MTTRLDALCWDAHDPMLLARFWAEALRWEVGERARRNRRSGPHRRHAVQDRVRRDRRCEVGSEPVPPRPHHRVARRPDRVGRAAARARRRATSTSANGRRKTTSCSPTRRATSSASSGPTTTSSPAARASGRSRATARRPSATSGATRSAGRCRGTRTRRPRSARPTAPGPMITWGGPPLLPKPAKNRQHLHLAPSPDSTQAAEVERLVALGATRIDIGQGDVELDRDGRPRRQRVLPAPGLSVRARIRGWTSSPISRRSTRSWRRCSNGCPLRSGHRRPTQRDGASPTWCCISPRPRKPSR